MKNIKINIKYDKLIVKELFKSGYWFYISENVREENCYFNIWKYYDADSTSNTYKHKYKDFLIKYDLK